MSAKVKNYDCWFFINPNREHRQYESLEKQASKIFIDFLKGQDYGGKVNIFRFDIYLEPTINLGLQRDGVYMGWVHISSHVDYATFNKSSEAEKLLLILNASLISIKYLAQRMTVPKGLEAGRLFNEYENYLKENLYLWNDKQSELLIIKPFNKLRFNFVITRTVEVKEQDIHYNLIDVEDFINNKLSGLDFGASIHRFDLGYEIADSTGAMPHNSETTNLKRYGTKYLLIVKQLDYNELKQLEIRDQFEVLKTKILEAIADVGNLKKKPNDFNNRKFFDEMSAILTEYEKNMIKHKLL